MVIMPERDPDGLSVRAADGAGSRAAHSPPQGQWEVTIATYGRRLTDRRHVFLNHDLYGEADGPIGMDYFVWVVRDGLTTVLVDTGFSAQGGAARGRQQLVGIRDLYDRLEVDPAGSPTVVVTHAHYDHIGNLGLFPSSPVIIAQRELAFWRSPMRDKPLFSHSHDPEAFAQLERAVVDDRVVLFDTEHQLAPGISVLEVGGHTPGQSMVVVDTSAGRVLLTSDAVHYYEELEREMPFSSVVDVGGMYAGFARIKELQSSGVVQHVVSGHDPQTLTRCLPGLEPGQMIGTIGGGNS